MDDKISVFIKKHFLDSSGIIYCRTRKECEVLQKVLKRHGLESCFYHSKVKNSVKEQILESWKDGSILIVVATIAFGLGVYFLVCFGLLCLFAILTAGFYFRGMLFFPVSGVNKANVRYVIHRSIPSSAEDYWQACGRAGTYGFLILMNEFFSEIVRFI